jgi:hypothetical protein
MAAPAVPTIHAKPATRYQIGNIVSAPAADTSSVKFEGDIAAFEAACLRGIRESLERYDRDGWSPFRTLVGVELEGTYPDTAVVVTYRYKPEYKPIPDDLRARFSIWPEPGEPSEFKPLSPSSDEMWSEAGEDEAFNWFIEPD